jgi:hypothetical protein
MGTVLPFPSPLASLPTYTAVHAETSMLFESANNAQKTNAAKIFTFLFIASTQPPVHFFSVNSDRCFETVVSFPGGFFPEQKVFLVRKASISNFLFMGACLVKKAFPWLPEYILI